MHESKGIYSKRVLLAWSCCCFFAYLSGCGESPVKTEATTSPTNRVERSIKSISALAPAPQTNLVIQAQVADQQQVFSLNPDTIIKLSVIAPSLIVTNEGVTPLAGSVSLRWNASPDEVAGYRIYWTDGTKSFSADAGPKTSARVEGLAEGSTLTFSVVAYNSIGYEGKQSPAVTVFLPARILMSTERISLQTYGVYGRTNHLAQSFDLENWNRLLTFIGNGKLKTVLLTQSLDRAFFKVITE